MSIIAITARLVIEPTRIDEYLAAAAEIAIPHTRAEAGCRLYAFARDIELPNVVWISEEWESDAALGQHLQSDHITRFLQKVADIQLLDMDVRKYSVSGIGSVTPPVVATA
ncbi:putative quinol monooxygenase [Pseudomonas jinjuensis]|uniref:Quinol monooxygenase YgiN n=1 Tax=Pseudomonas jinjuensis TaxID=198616 RepID=A0A1H0EJD7_9PSED|nr:putative quinol monooxygenase [Pseudomonas jinjuensis]SDN82435.1 Quinol monooxygenase YgiN [Pseudomonas jinjuensis]